MGLITVPYDLEGICGLTVKLIKRALRAIQEKTTGSRGSLFYI